METSFMLHQIIYWQNFCNRLLYKMRKIKLEKRKKMKKDEKR